LVGKDLLKVEVDMWTDSYPEDFGYIYAGLLTSLVHYTTSGQQPQFRRNLLPPS